jgi:hypothetical protein
MLDYFNFDDCEELDDARAALFNKVISRQQTRRYAWSPAPSSSSSRSSSRSSSSTASRTKSRKRRRRGRRNSKAERELVENSFAKVPEQAQGRTVYNMVGIDRHGPEFVLEMDPGLAQLERDGRMDGVKRFVTSYNQLHHEMYSTSGQDFLGIGDPYIAYRTYALQHDLAHDIAPDSDSHPTSGFPFMDDRYSYMVARQEEARQNLDELFGNNEYTGWQ